MRLPISGLLKALTRNAQTMQMAMSVGCCTQATGSAPRRTSRIVPPPIPVTVATKDTPTMSMPFLRPRSAPEMANTAVPMALR